MQQSRFKASPEEIARFCQRWHITEFALFGSILRDDFSDTSDIDVMVTFSNEHTPTLFDMVTMTDELETIFERKVDLLTRNSIENSPNHIRRNAILSNTQVIYASTKQARKRSETPDSLRKILSASG